MEKEIIEGNKLIAQFMDGKLCDGGFRQDVSEMDSFKFRNKVYKFSDLKYHIDWNWLMPVMEKIGKDYNVRITWCADGGTKGFGTTYIDRPDIFDKSIADFGGFGSIINTWKCVVKFIHWYNIKFKVKS